MDIKEVLLQAQGIVGEANLPSNLEEIAFSKAVDLLVAAKVDPKGGARAIYGEGPSGLEDDVPVPDSFVSRIAESSGIDLESVERVFADIDDGIELVIPSSKLPTGKSGATRQLALLVTYGRQAAGLEEYTSFATIRLSAEQYKRLDSTNFATTVNGMQDAFIFRGKNVSRAVKLSRPGKEMAIKLVKELAGISD